MRPKIDEDLLTAYALGELNAQERRIVGAYVNAYPDVQQYVAEVRETAGLVTDGLAAERGADGLTALQHDVLEHRLRERGRDVAAGGGNGSVAIGNGAAATSPMRIVPARPAAGRMRLRQWLPLAASIAASIAIVCGSLTVLILWMYPRPAAVAGRGDDDGRGLRVIRPGDAGADLRPGLPGDTPDDAIAIDRGATNSFPGEHDGWHAFDNMEVPKSFPAPEPLALQVPEDDVTAALPPVAPTAPTPAPNRKGAVARANPPANAGDAEDVRGNANRPAAGSPGSPGAPYQPRDTIMVSPPDAKVFDEVVKSGGATQPDVKVYENPFRLTSQRPRSSFPVRVEAGSYKLVRSHLLERRLPPAHQVRIEELVNRFRYDYATPADPDAALAATVEVAACPWDVKHRLARVAIKAREGGATVVARDVEVSVEFNPAATARWRLIGYENAAAAQGQPSGFAADLAAAGSATAFYEIVPAAAAADPRAPARDGLFTLKIRYRDPANGAPLKLELAATDAGHGFDRATPDFRFASAVAAFGLLLRDSQFKGDATYGDVIRWAASGKSADDESPERAAFIALARNARDAARNE